MRKYIFDRSNSIWKIVKRDTNIYMMRHVKHNMMEEKIEPKWHR